MLGPSDQKVEEEMEKEKPSSIKNWHFGAAAGGALFVGLVGAVVIHRASKKHTEMKTEAANQEIRKDLMDQMSPRD